MRPIPNQIYKMKINIELNQFYTEPNSLILSSPIRFISSPIFFCPNYYAIIRVRGHMINVNVANF